MGGRPLGGNVIDGHVGRAPKGTRLRKSQLTVGSISSIVFQKRMHASFKF
jgi:hypothetical protein